MILTWMMTKLMKKFEEVVNAAPSMSGVLAGTSRMRRILLKMLPPCPQRHQSACNATLLQCEVSQLFTKRVMTYSSQQMI